jgi:prevent-host-death family protein
MTVTDVKANLSALLTEIQGGEDIEITRHGRAVARLGPARGPHALKNLFAGIARTNASDEELFSTGEAWESS